MQIAYSHSSILNLFDYFFGEGKSANWLYERLSKIYHYGWFYWFVERM